MVLKPQDVVLALKLVAHGQEVWTYEHLAKELAMSSSEVHNGVRRLVQAKLLTPDRRPVRQALKEFLLHGVRYAFPPTLGGQTRGLPTAHAAQPLLSIIRSSEESAPVWPFPEGEVRGQSFSPLYPTVPQAALRDPALYELLALVDALRAGRARERDQAARMLEERLA